MNARRFAPIAGMLLFPALVLTACEGGASGFIVTTGEGHEFRAVERSSTEHEIPLQTAAAEAVTPSEVIVTSETDYDGLEGEDAIGTDPEVVVDGDSQVDDSSGLPGEDEGVDAPVVADDDGGPSSEPSPDTSAPPPSSGTTPPPSNNARLAECAQALGIPVARIKVAGNRNSLTLSASDGLLVHVTGNQNHLDLEAANLAPLGGICVFAAGNNAVIRISLTNVKVGQLVVRARGNQPQVEVDVAAGAAIQTVTANLFGNRPALRIQGEGSVNCERMGLILGGKHPEVQCME